MELSKKAKAVVGSLTLQIDAKAKQMKAEGFDVVGFGAGEPDFDTPEYIKAAAKEALDKGITKYTPASGSMDLKKAVAERLLRDKGLSYDASDIVISNGAKHSLFNVFMTILNPGDEVIIPAPYWVTYPEIVKMADGVPKSIHTEEKNGFKMTPAQFQRAITQNTQAVIINSPSNPTGGVYTRDELEEIANIALENEIFIVSDEIYDEIVYDGIQAISVASLSEEIKDITILVNGFSKSYSMTGWRLGYTACRKDIAKIMGDYQSHATSNPNSFAQYAGVIALKHDKSEMLAMVTAFDERRKYMVERINSIDGLSCIMPEGAFYVMLNISGAIDRTYQGRKIGGSMDFADIALSAKNVALVPGIAFGADNYERLSYATSMENIRKGLDRLEAFMGELD